MRSIRRMIMLSIILILSGRTVFAAGNKEKKAGQNEKVKLVFYHWIGTDAKAVVD